MKRIERGWAGHFCMGVECNWRRNTLIEDDKGRYIVVSSVGALPVIDKKGYRTKFQEIGFKRYYETMIFVGHEDGIFIEDVLIYNSMIDSIEEIEVHGTAELWTERMLLIIRL
jgi:hypothetical protein